MSVSHRNQHKRKASGGRKHVYRKKRKHEKGSFPTQTILGKTKMKISRTRGGNKKIRLLAAKQANVSNLKTGKTQKTEILRVIENPANIDYDRRGVMTKGTIIETPLGRALITSRPGQGGIINATLLPKKS
jgi:small subunit ribosomal protein S8e